MKTIDMLTTTRQLVETVTRPFAADELVRIPPGFSNHLLWQVGHLVVTQQVLCYKLAGVPMRIDGNLFALFGKGSNPAEWPTDGSVPSYEQLVSWLHEMAGHLRTDYDAGLFSGYQPYKTSAGVELASIEDAIIFNSYHEGIHFGSILGLRKALAAST